MTKVAPARAEDPVVFVIDDDPSMREALRSLFQSVGWRVELFGSAPEFIATPVFDGATPEQVDEALVSYQETHLDDGIGLTIEGGHMHQLEIGERVDMHVEVRAAGAAEFAMAGRFGVEVLELILAAGDAEARLLDHGD